LRARDHAAQAARGIEDLHAERGRDVEAA
jgi:hypothetical protein